MTRSESIAQLAAAMAKAQPAIAPAIKDAANPFFKSKYADLGEVWRGQPTADDEAMFELMAPRATSGALYRDLATEAGVPVDYHEADGLIHVWPILPLPEARKARRIIASTLRGTA